MRQFTYTWWLPAAGVVGIGVLGALAAAQDEPTAESRLVSALIGSKHDFSQAVPHPRDLCLPCHTPHLPAFPAPLADERPAAAQPIEPYRALSSEVDRASLVCLSCHDGVVAADVLTSSHATRLASQLGASRLGLGGLRGHPVGVKYPIADPKYRTIGEVIGDGAVKLPDGRVQCTSCHEPHNAGGHAGMLVKSNERSRLCLTCHRL